MLAWSYAHLVDLFSLFPNIFTLTLPILSEKRCFIIWPKLLAISSTWRIWCDWYALQMAGHQLVQLKSPYVIFHPYLLNKTFSFPLFLSFFILWFDRYMVNEKAHLNIKVRLPEYLWTSNKPSQFLCKRGKFRQVKENFFPGLFVSLRG